MATRSRSQHPGAREHAQSSFKRDARRRLGAHFPGRTLRRDPFNSLQKEDHTLHANDTTLILKHYSPAHTDSDISVHFVEADIFHTGDTFWNGYYPFIDYSTGGSIDGMIRATEVNLGKVTDKMIVIPGHGAVGDKSQLAFYRDLLVDTREKVATLKKQGKSLDEIVAAKPTAATDAKWGSGFRSAKDFIGDVFQGV